MLIANSNMNIEIEADLHTESDQAVRAVHSAIAGYGSLLKLSEHGCLPKDCLALFQFNYLHEF